MLCDMIRALADTCWAGITKLSLIIGISFGKPARTVSRELSLTTLTALDPKPSNRSFLRTGQQATRFIEIKVGQSSRNSRSTVEYAGVAMRA